ncbi:MAG: TonB-dependent receptor [Cyclobacteriaceae bacterium]|nr:TonB-dependent receptor [Cyclobacteriaceae bacterium]
MKWKLLPQLFFMSKLLFYGLVLQICFTGLLLASDGLAQEKVSIEEVYLSIDLKEASLEQTLNAITQKTKFKFAFEQGNIETSQSITTQVSNQSLASVLREISKSTDLTFKRVNDNIFISKKKFLGKSVEEEISGFGMLQSVSVSGKVLSGEDKSELPGVNIVVKGTSIGTVTDISGNYSLEVPGTDATLVFSSVGYITEEIAVGNRTVIDLTLNPDVTALSEIVVVGYGTQERAKVTGAISSVSAKEITQTPVVSFDQALQGRAPGVFVTNSGSPGKNPIVRIRGIGTTGNNDPLYVIDGVPAGGLNTINPNDIESIEVLKDASTAAIYGSRGANGVIMVTTKRGKSGKASIQFDGYYGVQKAWKQWDLLNVDQYLAYGRDLQTNGGGTIPDRFGNLGEFADVETNWQDEIFTVAPVQDYNLSVSGGSDNATFMVSGGYFNQEGILVGTGFERYSFRANSDFKIGRLKIGESLTVSHIDQQVESVPGGRSIIEHTIKMAPYIPVYDKNRLGGYRGPDGVDGNDAENPVLNAKLRQNHNLDLKLLGNVYGEFDFGAGFSYRLQLGIDYNQGNNSNFMPQYNAGSFHQNQTADISENNSRFFRSMITHQLNYNNTFGDHTIGASLIYEVTQDNFKQFNASGESSITSELQVLTGTETPNVSGDKWEYALISYLGRLNYDYKGKYLLSASLRRDGGSRFGPGNKWGSFPSVSLGWRLTEEDFMSNASWLSDLKLRASYGEVGNDRIGDYRYEATIDGNYRYNFNGNTTTASTISALANEQVKWESTKMTNIGLDMGFFNDRLRANVEWFQNNSEGLLLDVPIPFSFGYDGAPVANVGTVSNKGFEFALGYQDNEGAFTWTLDGNMSFVKNELVSLGIGKSIFGPGFENNPVTFTEEGQPIAYFYGWEVDRLFQSYDDIRNSPDQGKSPFNSDGSLKADAGTKTTAPGDIKFRDIAGPPDENGNPTGPDGKIDNNDRTNLGHFLPDFTYGLNFNANWKNFDLALFIQGVSGNEILNTNLYDLEGMSRLFNSGTAVLDRWTPQNTDTNIPRAVTSDPNNNARISSRYVEDGSYMRVKNLTVGYTIPSEGLNSFANGAIKNVRIYLSANNLLTFTNYSGYDPEIGARDNASLATGVDYGQYPQPRTILGGIQIGF